ncbi:MAG: hypothetical protein U0869_07305 [Chloroflexota bacterium]
MQATTIELLDQVSGAAAGDGRAAHGAARRDPSGLGRFGLLRRQRQASSAS